MALFSSARKIQDNGLYVIPEEQREILAIYASGEIYFSEGKKFNKLVLDAKKQLSSEGLEPKLIEVSPEELWGHYSTKSLKKKANIQEGYHKLAARILEDAARARSSDIKIIRTPQKTSVRFLIAGQEIEYNAPITSHEGNEVISFLFDSRDEGSGHSTKTQGEFQGFSISDNATGSSSMSLPDTVLKLRCQKGFHETDVEIMDHLVMRLFYREQADKITLQSLGHDPDTLAALQRARDGLKGAVIIGGETGDGKSTTIITAVRQQYEEHEGKISIVTVEDPVEYKLDEPGIIQIPIQSSGDAAKRTANYRSALMHFVRINPHVGVVSEIRDAEAARQVLQFIETGHQVWSTIHINNVNSIPFRLIDMGIAPTEMSKQDSIKLMMKQTLVPLLCSCAKKDENGFRRRNKDGCSKCVNKSRGAEAAKAWAGFKRLVALSEFIEPDDTYLRMIRANDSIGAKAHWITPKEEGGLGGITLAEKMNMLAHVGLIDPDSAIKKGASILPKCPSIPDHYKPWLKSLVSVSS